MNIQDASTEDLRNFAKLKFGLDIHRMTGKPKIIAALRAAGFNDDEFEAETVVTPVPTPAPKIPTSGNVTITLQRDSSVGGKDMLPVGVNGKVMLLPRGKPISIPRAYYEVLRNANILEYALDEQSGIGEATEVPAHSFSVHG
jgi:hypothetical protein